MTVVSAVVAHMTVAVAAAVVISAELVNCHVATTVFSHITNPLQQSQVLYLRCP